jgi:cyclic pyranopterin phosphate synthase
MTDKGRLGVLSHVNEDNQPQMVDVGGKVVTRRVAHARAVVVLPGEAAALLRDGELLTKKGPVFQTATLAGIMGAKRTSELIPLCHPIGLDDCRVEIAAAADGRVVIDCRTSVHHKTGVEMEALTGATVAALTIYDMCKAISHDIVIESVQLMGKQGGKRDFSREERA